MMDTYEKVLKYLESHKKLSYDIEFYRNKMTGLKAISYSQEEKGTSLNNMMLMYMKKIEKAEEKQKEIEQFIENSFNGLDRLIIQKRFINNMTLESIGTDIGYSKSRVGGIIKKAIYRYLAR